MSIANTSGHPATPPRPATGLISPEQFWTAFQSVARDFDTRLVAAWSDTAAYTTLIRSGLFPALARELKLTCHARDYWSIDAILYREKHGPPFHERETYAKCIDVAIEHESVAERSHEEINKLQIINAPLKVLITYPGACANRQRYLDRYLPIIQAADTFGDISTLRRQLVIFGCKENGRICWSAYVYAAPGFLPLAPSPVGPPSA